MKANTHPRLTDAKKSVWIDIVEGLAYLKQNRLVLTLIIMAAIPSMFIMPYVTLMPAFVAEVFVSDPKVYGLLMSSIGIGALTGALGLAAMSSFPYRGAVLLSAGILASFALVLFTFCHAYWMALLFLPFIGIAMTTNAATANSTLQMLAPPEIRGRVLSVYMFASMGLGPVSNLQAGWLAHVFGTAIALRIGAVICCIALLWIAATKREIRGLKVG